MELQSKNEGLNERAQEYDLTLKQEEFLKNPKPITKIIPANGCIIVPRKVVNKYIENTKDGNNLILKTQTMIDADARKVGSEPYPVVAMSESAKSQLKIEELDYVMLQGTEPSFEFKYKGLFFWVYQAHEVIAGIKKNNVEEFIN